jgi:hypothetical protein
VTSVAPDPVAGPGQVVVDVSVAPVLMLETQRWRGWGGEWFTVRAGRRGSRRGDLSWREHESCLGRAVGKRRGIVGRVRHLRQGSRLPMAERRHV